MSDPISLVQVCTAFDSGGACTSFVWMPYSSGVVPTLSAADAMQIGYAIAVLWAVAFGLRQCRKLLQES